MPPRIDLDQLFPAAPPHQPHQNQKTGNPEYISGTNGHHAGMVRHDERIKTRWTSIYTLELRGLTQVEIAAAIGMSPQGVSNVVSDPRYIAYREEHMAKLDAEFVGMKPLAFAALRSGLNSRDENTALRASEQWFKGAGFGGFAKDPVPATRTTAEDVAAALIAGIQVNVQVNTGSKGDD